VTNTNELDLENVNTSSMDEVKPLETEQLEDLPTLADAVTDSKAASANQESPSSAAPSIESDLSQLAPLIPFLIPDEQTICAMLAPVAAFGMQNPERDAFVSRFPQNEMVLAGLRTVQFRKALETLIVTYLKTPTTGDGAPALSPLQAVMAGFGAIAFGAVLERFGLADLIKGVLAGGQTNTNASGNNASGVSDGVSDFEAIIHE
jgi:hypothetical protein